MQKERGRARYRL